MTGRKEEGDACTTGKVRGADPHRGKSGGGQRLEGLWPAVDVETVERAHGRAGRCQSRPQQGVAQRRAVQNTGVQERRAPGDRVLGAGPSVFAYRSSSSATRTISSSAELVCSRCHALVGHQVLQPHEPMPARLLHRDLTPLQNPHQRRAGDPQESAPPA